MSVVIITVGVGFNWLVKEHMRAAEALKKKTEAMLDARSNHDLLIYSILSGQVTQKGIVLYKGVELLGVVSLPLNSTKTVLNERIAVRLQDSNGLVSLTGFDRGTMSRLIGQFSDDTRASIVADSLLDWIDQDNLVRLNGAEEQFYRGENKPGPRNYPLQYKEEISMIRGMDQPLFTMISPYVTMLPNVGFNPNTAPDQVLMAYLNITSDVLEGLKVYMAGSPVSSDATLFALTGRKIVVNEGVYFFPSRYWDITIEVGGSRPLYTMHSGIDMNQTMTAPYSIIYWKED